MIFDDDLGVFFLRINTNILMFDICVAIKKTKNLSQYLSQKVNPECKETSMSLFSQPEVQFTVATNDVVY